MVPRNSVNNVCSGERVKVCLLDDSENVIIPDAPVFNMVRLLSELWRCNALVRNGPLPSTR